MVATHRWIGALLGASLALAVVLLGAVPARAADVFIQVTPRTVEAGLMVGIKASCRVNTSPATVESAAFGTVIAQPRAGFLIATGTVPANTHAATFRVRLSCPDGNIATTQLIVVASSGQPSQDPPATGQPSQDPPATSWPSQGPATGFGGTARDGPGGLLAAGGIVTAVLGAMLGLVALRRRSGPATPRPVRGQARS